MKGKAADRHMLFRILLFSLTYLLIFSAAWTLHAIAYTDHTCAPGDVEDGRDFAGTVNRVKIFGIFLNSITCIFFWLSNASCINTQSSYNCSCDPNYVGDGFNCEGAFDFFYDCQFVKDRLGLIHCRSGGHFWPNKGNLSSHQVYLKFTSFFNALLENANLDILLSKNFE